MKNVALFISLLSMAVAGTVEAQALRDPVEIAEESGVCGDAGVASAVYQNENTEVSATCNEGVLPILPAGAAGALTGGLVVPIVGAVAVLAVAAGGSGANGTNGTNGTN